jgi:hypothetical protein
MSVALCLDDPVLDFDGLLEFLNVNPGAVIFDFGRVDEKSIEESSFSCVTADDAKLALAKELFKRLRKTTKAGMVGVNPDSGASARYASHRYSSGAEVAHRGGTRLLSLPGKVYFVPDPRQGG